MPSPVYSPGVNPFAAGSDFPGTDPSVVLPGGVTGVMADYTHKVEGVYETIVVASWDKTEKRSAKATRIMRFYLTYLQLDVVDADTLWNHKIAQSGRLRKFTYFDELSGESFEVRYATDVVSRETFAFEAEKTTVELIEVR